MDVHEIISEIIRLESIITSRVISDRNFRPTDDDEYKDIRKRLKELRETVKSYL